MSGNESGNVPTGESGGRCPGWTTGTGGGKKVGPRTDILRHANRRTGTTLTVRKLRAITTRLQGTAPCTRKAIRGTQKKRLGCR